MACLAARLEIIQWSQSATGRRTSIWTSAKSGTRNRVADKTRSWRKLIGIAPRIVKIAWGAPSVEPGLRQWGAVHSVGG